MTGEPGLMEMFDLANLDPKEYKIGEVNGKVGKACLEYMDFAISQAMKGEAEAVVFAPLNKLAMSLGGSDFKDEHGYFARHTKAELYGEINALDPLFTSRVTSHIGFRDIANRLTPDRIVNAVKLLHQTMSRAGIQKTQKSGWPRLIPTGGRRVSSVRKKTRSSNPRWKRPGRKGWTWSVPTPRIRSLCAPAGASFPAS